jgi:hypothetical protein
MAFKKPLFKGTVAPLESRDTGTYNLSVDTTSFLFLLAWTSVLTWSRRFRWEIHICIALSRRWEKHGGEGTQSTVHSLAPSDLRTRNKSNVPAVGWCRSIFYRILWARSWSWIHQTDVASTKLATVPAKSARRGTPYCYERSRCSPSLEGVLLVLKFAASFSLIFSLQAHDVGKCISLVLPVLVTLKELYMRRRVMKQSPLGPSRSGFFCNNLGY